MAERLYDEVVDAKPDEEGYERGSAAARSR